MIRCTTCGERLMPNEKRCPTCGASAPLDPFREPVPASPRASMPSAAMLPGCPRCGYTGPSESYFSRSGNLAVLVGLGVFTYGIGALAYWLARHKRQLCPQCGLRRHGAQADGYGYTKGSHGEVVPLPSSGGGLRVSGSVFAILGAFLMSMGLFVEGDPGMVVVGSMFGASGGGMFLTGWKRLQDRRHAITGGLQRRILRLATQRQGLLTVTEVAASLSMSLRAAERLLDSMNDGLRVRSDVTDEGVIVYEFPELQHRAQLEAPAHSDRGDASHDANGPGGANGAGGAGSATGP